MKAQNPQPTACVYFCRLHKRMNTGQGVIISLAIKSANLFCFFFFAVRCVQPQVIFPLQLDCAIVAQHVVTTVRLMA